MSHESKILNIYLGIQQTYFLNVYATVIKTAISMHICFDPCQTYLVLSDTFGLNFLPYIRHINLI